MLLLLSVALTLVLITYLLRRTRNTKKALVPPGPPGLPLIGNTHQLLTANNQHVYLWKLSKKYGPIIQLNLGSAPVLVISSPKLAREVLKTQDLAFCSRPRLLGQQKLSYNGLDMVFSPYGEFWRDVRKIAAVHFLSLKKIQSFRPTREDEVHRMVAKISASGHHPQVDLSEAAMALGSSMICRIAFGKRYEHRDSDLRRFRELLHECQALFASFFVVDYFPWFGWVDRISGLNERLDKNFRDLDAFYEELIREHLDPERAKTKKEEDVLDILIRLKEEKTTSIDLNWDHIKGMLMNIFVAATDTSAASTVWTMTALMKAPEVMAKVQTEIRNVVGKKGKVDEDDLPNLPYLKAVISEALRLYPPAPLLVPRETIETCTLEGYEIRPGTVVFVNAWAVARDPEYWEKAEEFMPERFLNSSIDIRGQDYGVIPFGSGRRICPGMLMGIANVELTVSNLLYSFDWETPPGVRAEDIDMDVLSGITMHKKNPLLLVAKKYVV